MKLRPKKHIPSPFPRYHYQEDPRVYIPEEDDNNKKSGKKKRIKRTTKGVETAALEY